MEIIDLFFQNIRKGGKIQKNIDELDYFNSSFNAHSLKGLWLISRILNNGPARKLDEKAKNRDPEVFRNIRRIEIGLQPSMDELAALRAEVISHSLSSLFSPATALS